MNDKTESPSPSAAPGVRRITIHGIDEVVNGDYILATDHDATVAALAAQNEALREALRTAQSLADEHRGYGEHPEQLGEIIRVCEAALLRGSV